MPTEIGGIGVLKSDYFQFHVGITTKLINGVCQYYKVVQFNVFENDDKSFLIYYCFLKPE